MQTITIHQGGKNAAQPGLDGNRRLSERATAFLGLYDKPPQLEDREASPGQVLAAFKGAARYMKLSRTVVDAIDYLFSVSYPQDWVAGCRPLVWPSAREQGEALGLSPTRVKALNRRLIELGLILAKDSPTGTRWGRRNHNGVIVAAFGFDLSPLAHRIGEFKAIRAAGDEERATRADLRRRKTIALRSIQQVVRTAGDHGFDSPDLYDLADTAYRVPETADAQGNTAAFEAYVGAIEDIRAHVKALYEVLATQAADKFANRGQSAESGMNEDKSDPSGPDFGPPYYNYKPTSNLTTCTRREGGGSEFSGNGAERPNSQKPETSTQLDEGRRGPARAVSPPNGERPQGQGGGLVAPPVDQPALPTIKPREIISLAPAIASYLNRDIAQLDDSRAIEPVMRAAEVCAFQNLGLSKALWGEANSSLGAWGAVLAVMVVAAKNPEHFSRTPAHYFAGMIERAKRGELNLARSIWGLRSQAQKGQA